MAVAITILVLLGIAFVVCLLKGKPWFAGLILVAGIFPIVGAIRTAKPTSWWARKYYPRDGHQMALAIQRFPKSADKLEARETAGLPPAPVIKKVF